MKWKQYILIATFLTLLIPTKVYAGNINGNEQSVIAVASGTFEYKGVTYKATSQHLAELRAKLMQDDVDLTTEQAREAIASIYANVKTGIDEGYIVPISGSSNSTEKDVTGNNNESNKTENSQDKDSSATQSSQNGGETQNTDKNSTDNKTNVENKNNTTNTENTSNSTDKNSNTNNNSATDNNSQKIETNKDKTSNESTQTSTSDNVGNESTTGKTEQKEEIKEVKTPEQLKWEKEQLPILKKQKENIIAENFVEELEVISSETVIKDTACNFSNIWLVPIIFFVGIGICIMSIMKYHLLAHKNES